MRDAQDDAQDDDARRGAAVSAFDQAPLFMYVAKGPDLRIAAYNEVIGQVVGDRPLGRPMAEEFPELVNQQLLDMWSEVARTGAPQSAREWRMQLETPGDGTAEIYMDFTLTPWRGDDGEVRGVIATGVDVTEQVRARERGERERARLGRELLAAQELVTALQDSLLPDSLPVLPSMDVAARYLLASDDTAAGGDWFDTVVSEDGTRVVLVVGDVVGHGVAASAVMGRLRAVLHQRLLAGAPITDALADLDLYARATPEAHAATVCVVELDPESGEMSYCTAGHPPPLVVTSEAGAHYLAPSGSTPLATTDTTYRTTTASLGHGDVVLLYTDGLVERPGRTTSQNTVELARVAGDAYANRVMPESAPARASERLCEQVLELLTRTTGHGDDITLLAAQRVDAPPPLAVVLDGVQDGIPVVRRHLDAWLQPLDLSDADHLVLQHVVGELFANAVEHAYGNAGGPVEVRAALTPSGDLAVEVSDHGQFRTADPDPRRGRGLAMVSRLADHLDVRPADDGTVVEVRHRLSREPVFRPGTGHRKPVSPHLAAGRFSVRLDEQSGLVVVSGPLDLVSAPQLHAALQRATHGGSRAVEVDLSGLTLLSSAGVQVLFEQTTDARLRLVAPVGSVAQHVMELVSLPYATESQQP